MPGPLSQPRARIGHALITGKTKLKARGLKSREGLNQEDHRMAIEAYDAKMSKQEKEATPTDMTEAIKEIRK